MSTVAEHPNGRSTGQGKTLVVQSGIEHSDTIDLMRDVDEETLEIADDLYEAIARVGAANGSEPITSVFIPLMIPEYTATRVVQAFKRLNPLLHLILIAPKGRNEAASDALKAGFDHVLEIPSTAHAISKLIQSTDRKSVV